MDIFKKVKIDTVIHFIMIAFALGSVANVFSYLAGSGHDRVSSALIALGLGTGLAASAIMATKINMKQEPRSFWSVLGIVFLIGLVSGFVQTQSYVIHGSGIFKSSIMGFGIPIAGELLLALAFSIFHGADKRTKIHEADLAVEVATTEAIATIMSNVDARTHVKYVEAQIGKVVKFKADKMLSTYIVEPDKEDNYPKQITDNSSPLIEKKSDNPTPKKNIDSDRNSTPTQANKDMLMSFLARNPASKKADIMSMFQSKDVSISDKTVSRYLSDIGAIREGHCYSLPSLELSTIPENQVGHQYTNGVVQ